MDFVLQQTWGWQASFYLFCGGTSAGIFIICAVLFLLDQVNHVRLIRVGFVSASLLLLAGAMFLLGDLLKPEAGILFWRSFTHFSSWMARGFWIICSGLLLMVGSAVVLSKPRPSSWRPAILVLINVGIVISLAVATYTGILLYCAFAIPFWHTIWLPLLFVVSALNCGIAAIRLLSGLLPQADRLKPLAYIYLRRAAVVLTLSEAVLLTLWLGSMMSGSLGAADVSLPVWASVADTTSQKTAQASASHILTGDFSQSFWLVVVLVGIVVPLMSSILEWRIYGGSRAARKRFSAALREEQDENAHVMSMLGLIGSCCVILGAWEMRFIIIAAGIHVPLIQAALTALA